MATLAQVLGNEPVSPRRLNPAVPRDLETVCLKCLEKAPARRYASAADLAADLRRFLDGNPVAARPLGSLARSLRWCWRQPLLAASLAASVLILVAASIVSGTLAYQASESARAVRGESR